MKRTHLTLLAGFCLALSVAMLGSWLGDPPAPHLDTPPCRWRTAEERAATLEALREAWANRPLEKNEENDRAERVFLNRLIIFLCHSKHRENFGPACGLWNNCDHDHTLSYRDLF